MSYHIQVERMAGMGHGHRFDHAISLMKHRGEPEQFDTRAEAEAVAQHYRDQINAHTICAKIYTVIRKDPEPQNRRYTITRCPNTPAVKAAAARLRRPNYRHRNRGRGPRFARYPGDVQYHQSLPLKLAYWFTVYGEPKSQTWEPWKPITCRAEFVKLEKDGRLRVRLLNENH